MYDHLLAFHVRHGTHNSAAPADSTRGPCAVVDRVAGAAGAPDVVCDGFLPWHRRFLRAFEDALRATAGPFSCVTVPFWDWSLDLGAGKLDSAVVDELGGWGESTAAAGLGVVELRRNSRRVLEHTTEGRACSFLHLLVCIVKHSDEQVHVNLNH